jgi:hypothetical protein
MKILISAVIGVFGAAAAIAGAEPVKLPAGMLVELELQHHVTSGYLPAGSPIYFRVAKDVAIGDQTLIRKDTLVTGKMQEARGPGMAGRSGSMMLNVHTLAAVDGAIVPIECDLAKQGRSRGGAVLGWTLFWGIPGLMTHGVNPYLERGAVLDAEVTNEVTVDSSKLVQPEVVNASVPQAQPLNITGHRFEGSTAKIFTFDIERKQNLKTVDFNFDPPAGTADSVGALSTVELVSVDNKPVPQPIRALSTTAKSMKFDGWSVIEFCRDGNTELGFRGVTADGQSFSGSYPVAVKIKKKK